MRPPPSTRPISLGTTKDSRRGSDGGVPRIGSGTTRSRPYAHAPFINQLFTLRFRQPVGRRRFPRDRSFFSRENDFTRVEGPPAEVSLPPRDTSRMRRDRSRSSSRLPRYTRIVARYRTGKLTGAIEFYHPLRTFRRLTSANGIPARWNFIPADK